MPHELVPIGPNLTDTGLALPPDLSVEQWMAHGQDLGRIERAVGWWIGDWWNYADKRFGERKAIVTAPTWTGPDIKTCMNAGVVCRAFPPSRRRDVLTYTHHAELASIPADEADVVLHEAEAQVRAGDPMPPTRALRQEVKRIKRNGRETALAGAIAKASAELGSKLYGVIYADPPWQFEPRSRETGMDRSAANHYPLMGVDEIIDLHPPAAADAVLFLWATAPMLLEALDVMEGWGFDYRSQFVWVKERAGTGYWARSQHELLLVGTRGAVPAPAQGQQFSSVIQAASGEHSAKPAVVREMIEELYPSLPLLEMFARGPAVAGWDRWGAEAEKRDAA